MSGDAQWEPLADVYFTRSSETARRNMLSIYCLCSRVFLKYYADVYANAIETDEVNEDALLQLQEEDTFKEDEPIPHFAGKIGANTSQAPAADEDADANSCYYSASASHTDNYCSTDEHDPLVRERVHLQSSDSGADISEEYHFGRIAAVAGTAHGRSNSLPGDGPSIDVRDMNRKWEIFWAATGEQLIWASWIEKYGEYINPEYSGPIGPETPSKKHDEQPQRTETEIRISSCSPAAVAHPDLIHSADHLLSPRCESVTSSIPITIATTDSMTNVTHLTLSSGDFGGRSDDPSNPHHHHSSVSECSQMSDSIHSSEMLITSSNSSQSPDDDLMLLADVEAKVLAANSISSSNNPDDADTLDNDQHWQILWQKHFQEQYTEQYRVFMEAKRAEHILCGSSVPPQYSLDEESPPGRSRWAKRGRALKKRRSNNNPTEPSDLHDLVHQLSIEPKDGGGGGAEEHWECEMVDTEGANADGGKGEAKADDGPTEVANSDFSAMAAMGLPTAFGKAGVPDEGEGNRNPNDKSTALKRSHENDDETSDEMRSSRDRLKSAMTLMGFAFDEQGVVQQPAMAEVCYRKKHIRLSNRNLRLQSVKAPRHIHFDDDGCEVPAEKTNIAVEHPHHSSSEDEYEMARATAPLSSPAAQKSRHDSPTAELTAVELYAPRTMTLAHRLAKKKRKFPPEIAEDRQLYKYWARRYLLFSRFDQGIRLDRESWFSVTPETVAIHTANRMQCDVIVDAFCGAGGNTIQFAQVCHKVISIDIDPVKIEMARHNAQIYGVADHIDFIVGDFLQLSGSLKADAVFLSPPWGGPEYLKNSPVFNIETALLPVSGTELMAKARQISHNVAIFLPRSSDMVQVVNLAQIDGDTANHSRVEVEQNFLDRGLVAITAYFGDLAYPTSAEHEAVSNDEPTADGKNL